jgi:hypothetical protein
MIDFQRNVLVAYAGGDGQLGVWCQGRAATARRM